MLHAAPPGGPLISLLPLTPDRLDDFAALLGSPDFGGCFCAAWTHHGPDWVSRCGDPSRPNLGLTRADVLEGRKPGFLVEEDEEVVAWTGAGPRPEFPLLASRLGTRRSEHTGHTWFVGCLAIREAHRGRGLSEAMVRAVTEEARRAGAQRVEAAPTDPWDEPRSYRGALSLYRRLGFVEVCREADGDSEIVLVEYRL